MIKITTIFGEDAVREYEENNELPSEEWLADNGGVVDENADGWSDYHIIRHRSEEADTSREENLWLRLGISVRGSREDIERILNGDTETLRKLLDAGRYGISGETYVPGSTTRSSRRKTWSSIYNKTTPSAIMITVKVLLGKDTVSIYRKTGDISSVESTAESGGYVITRHFETEAEYKAYAMAVEDLDGHEDWQMLAPAVTPEAPFRKGEFVRLTDDAIKRIRESFGDGPADYRKEMILEVIAWCRYEGTWIIEVRDIREDDTQEFDAVFLRPLTARDLVAISAPRHPLSTAIYPIHIR